MVRIIPETLSNLWEILNYPDHQTVKNIWVCLYLWKVSLGIILLVNKLLGLFVSQRTLGCRCWTLLLCTCGLCCWYKRLNITCMSRRKKNLHNTVISLGISRVKTSLSRTFYMLIWPLNFWKTKSMAYRSPAHIITDHNQSNVWSSVLMYK